MMLFDTGKKEKSVNGSDSMLVEKEKEKENRPGEIKLPSPLVWIDLEMTGEYVLFAHENENKNAYVLNAFLFGLRDILEQQSTFINIGTWYKSHDSKAQPSVPFLPAHWSLHFRQPFLLSGHLCFYYICSFFSVAFASLN